MTAVKRLDKGDFYEVSLPNDVVTRCSVDDAFTIQFLESGVILVIEQPFTTAGPEGERTLDPQRPEELGRALAVLHKTPRDVKAHKNGVLEVTFNEGLILRVDPHPDYEAWHVSGRDGVMIVAMPGGELATWGASHGGG